MKQFFTSKRMIILSVLAVLGFIAGRLIFRAVLNLLMGGTLFGGDLF